VKKLLTVVVIAALVFASFSLFSLNVKAADTSQAHILSYSWYVAPSTTVLASAPGDLIVVGEVQNIGANVIANVTIDGTAFSSTGSALATITNSPAFVYDMLPGQKAPFYLDFNVASSISHDLSWVPTVSAVSLTINSVDNTASRQYADLTASHPGIATSFIDAAGIYTVYGTIVNTGSQAAVTPWVVTTFYNASGTVIGLNYTSYLTASLAPNVPVRFFATPADNSTQRSSEITSYSIQIDSLTMTTSNGPTPTATKSATSPSTAQFPTLPIVVIVVLIVVAVAALIVFRRRRKATPIPPPPPT
jgi:hypothetical protein